MPQLEELGMKIDILGVFNLLQIDYKWMITDLLKDARMSLPYHTYRLRLNRIIAVIFLCIIIRY